MVGVNEPESYSAAAVDSSDPAATDSCRARRRPARSPARPAGRRQRHVGDLGTIQADDERVAHVAITDKVIAFSGAHSRLGRAIVVHQGEDPFTQPSGDAGGRVAVGIIGIAPQ